jgi:hypothetical protein
MTPKMSEKEHTLLTELLEECVTLSDFNQLKMMHHVCGKIYGFNASQKSGVHIAVIDRRTNCTVVAAVGTNGVALFS